MVLRMLIGTAVALLAEGVGRNNVCADRLRSVVRVALLAEGVGRNKYLLVCALLAKSPSSRRAWVEIVRH